MYATDCNFQNNIKNEQNFNKLNLKAWGFVSFSFLCLSLYKIKTGRMISAKVHHSHHGKIQSQGRL